MFLARPGLLYLFTEVKGTDVYSFSCGPLEKLIALPCVRDTSDVVQLKQLNLQNNFHKTFIISYMYRKQ